MSQGNGADGPELPTELRGRVPDDAPEAALIARLWAAALDPAEAEPALEEAVATGQRAGAAARTPDEIARRVLTSGRSIVAEAERRGLIDEARARRLGELVDEATLRATAGCVAMRAERREAWLSFLSHEIKNPLNTVLNALWLLREHRDGAGRERFFELAERAVRRIEARLAEVRDLERLSESAHPARLTGPPPAAADPGPPRP